MNSLFSEADMKKMGCVPDGKGGFRVMTKKEKQLAKEPSSKKVITYHNVAEIDESNPFFIPGDVPSSKNGKQFFKNKKTGKMFIAKSNAALAYQKVAANWYATLGPMFRKKLEGLQKPYRIEFHFVFSKKMRFDYHNMCQLPYDMMTESGWIDDDSADELIPYFKPYSINRKKPGLYISIL